MTENIYFYQCNYWFHEKVFYRIQHNFLSNLRATSEELFVCFVFSHFATMVRRNGKSSFRSFSEMNSATTKTFPTPCRRSSRVAGTIKFNSPGSSTSMIPAGDLEKNSSPATHLPIDKTIESIVLPLPQAPAESIL